MIADVGNISGAKDKHIAAMRFDEVVTKFVHEHLVARIDRAAGNDFIAAIADPR